MTNAWPLVQLGDISASVDYGHTASAEGEAVGPRFLRITDIQDGSVDWERVPFCRCSNAEEDSAKLAGGDIVFARTGATTGKSFLIRRCPERAVFASYLIRIRPSRAAEPSYLSHFFQSAGYWAQIRRSARGAAQAGVNATVLKTIRLPLPPLPEQRRIAAILDQADALRAKRRQALARLDTLTQSIFLEMFGDPTVNPRGWRQTEVSDLAAGKYGVKAGPFGSSLLKESYTDSGFRVYGQEQVIAGRLDVGDYYVDERTFQRLSSCAVKEGDLLVSLVGSFGRVLVVPPIFEPGIINPRLLKITPRGDVVRPEFLARCLEQDAIQDSLERMSHGGTMGILNAGLVKRLRVICPPVDAQDRFLVRVAAIERLKSTQRASLAQLDALFASLQQRAFREGFGAAEGAPLKAKAASA